MTENTQKFVFKEFSKDKVRNMSHTEHIDEKAEIINQAVVEHFDNITNEDEASEQEPATKVAADKSMQDLTENSQDNAEAENTIQVQENIIPVLDVEQIKEEEYKKGYEAAKQESQAIIDQLKQDNQFIAILSEKINNFAIKDEYAKDLLNQIRDIVNLVAEKLYKELPTNFTNLLTEYISNLIQDNNKIGFIVIKIHPERKKLTEDVLELDKIEESKKAAIKIIEDDNLNTDDCLVEWNNGRWEYKIEQISAEIDKILKNAIAGKNSKEIESRDEIIAENTEIVAKMPQPDDAQQAAEVSNNQIAEKQEDNTD